MVVNAKDQVDGHPGDWRRQCSAAGAPRDGALCSLLPDGCALAAAAVYRLSNTQCAVLSGVTRVGWGQHTLGRHQALAQQGHRRSR